MGRSSNGNTATPTAPAPVRSAVMPPGFGLSGAPQPVMAPAPQMRTPSAPNVFQQSARAFNSALQGAQQGMNFAPERVSAATMTPAQMRAQGFSGAQIQGVDPITAQAVASGQIANTNLGAYQNPFEQQVVGFALQDLDRANQMALNSVGAQATGAGAFGGSRQAIAEAETNRAFADQAARTAAGLRQAGFNTALQSAQFDIGSAMQAALANQSASLQAGTTNAANMLQTQMANQGSTNLGRQFTVGAANQAAAYNQAALNNARQFNALAANQMALANQQAGLAASQQRLGAASQMGNLSNLGFGMGQQINQNMMQQGAMQQALQQQLINAARGQFQGFTGAPQQALSLPLAALGAAPVPQSQTQSRQPGLFDFLTLGATALGGLCWVAREVYGEQDPRWLQFREWLTLDAPEWLYNLYAKHGERFAGVVRKVPVLKRVLRPLMDRARRAAGYEG